MKRVIFTIYFDIIDKSNYENQMLVNEYFDRLIENKKQYAKHIGVDFKFFHNTSIETTLFNEFNFTEINLYKHFLMEQLAEEYDEIMYIDMDVLFNTKENVFNELNLSDGIHIKDQDCDIKNKNIMEVLYKSTGNRSPTLKYHITKELLNGKDNHVLNTGIIIGKSEHIKLINFFNRLPNIIKKINVIKRSADNPCFLKTHFYPNNEAIFSYILEKYNIPYVLLDNKWHNIVDSTPKTIDFDNTKIFHFINKKFNCFFNDKSKVVFSIYIKIPDEKLDNPKNFPDDSTLKSKRTVERLTAYKDKIIDNHKSYAESIGATYIIFENNDQYQKFSSNFSFLSEYDKINLYKIWLLDMLTNQFDLVLYVDLDVYFRQDIDIFNFVPAEYSLCCQYRDRSSLKIQSSNYYFKSYNYDFRNPHSKYWNCHALLDHDEKDSENNVFNTGILAASKHVMNQVNYFDNIEKLLLKMKTLKEDTCSMYPDKIKESFGYDNETILSYKVKINQVPTFNLDLYWHYKHEYRSLESFNQDHIAFKIDKEHLLAECKKNKTVIIHFISKNFGLVFD